jgi:Ni,Fe-hydrogenase III large subunit
MSYTIPLGPYHPALEEPYKIDVACEGETVRDATLHIGFNFRGIEWLAERRNYIQDIALVERVCGICSGVHTLTFCMAVERLAELTVPRRAEYIRVIIAELERLHSHILWAGIAAEVMGFQTLFMTCFALRERIMDVLEAVSGNRVNYAMNCIGGVNRDITDPEVVLAAVQAFEQELTRTLIPVVTSPRTGRCRLVVPGWGDSQASRLRPGARSDQLPGPRACRRISALPRLMPLIIGLNLRRRWIPGATCWPGLWCGR